MAALTFSEAEIQRLFGNEAAEDEDLDRLRQYYVKSSTYDQVVTDLPIRIPPTIRWSPIFLFEY